MSTTLTDPRTELVLANADDVECITCEVCWSPGKPMVCGRPDYRDDAELCPDDCGHPTCPMCEAEWDSHERSHRPWWKRWLP